jgi:antitoxin VapB
MRLNIKNRDAHLMAEELSKLTGESMTTAVTIALREPLARVRQKQGLSLADRLLAIGMDCAARLEEPFRSADHGGLIYDERKQMTYADPLCRRPYHRIPERQPIILYRIERRRKIVILGALYR